VGKYAWLLCPAAAAAGHTPAVVTVAHVHAAVEHDRSAAKPHDNAAAPDILTGTCRGEDARVTLSKAMVG
jgi:hypothetical protein